jgi:hypothetical protein
VVISLTHIWEVLRLNPGRDTGYPDWRLPWFSLIDVSKFQHSSSLQPWLLPSESPFICHPYIPWYIV